MNQTIGAYIDAILGISFGIAMLFFAPFIMRKNPRAEQLAGIFAVLLGYPRSIDFLAR